jgi:hypothetical protein
MVADGSTQNGTQSFLVRNDTVYVQFHFVNGTGPATPYPLYRKINVPAPWTFGVYKIVAQGIYNGQVHQTLTSRIGICATVSGIKHPDAETPGLKIYPNPAQAYVQVELPESKIPASIILTDLSGKTLFTKKVQPNQRTISLNMKQLPAGLYLLQYRSAEIMLTRKFLKQ